MRRREPSGLSGKPRTPGLPLVSWAWIPLFLAVGLVAGCRTPAPDSGVAAAPVLVIHGGAGVPSKSEITPEREKAYREGLEASLRAGHAVLRTGGSSLDAVAAAVRVLEDNPLFNAGRGAALNHEGEAELDAAVMDGATLHAGAVAGVRRVRNPVDAARAVMEKTSHVLIAGNGADAFAASVGLPLVPNDYFITEPRRQQLRETLEAERRRASLPARNGFGTVGAVALDQKGHLAAATSTGGLAGKKPGRIGDSPIVGAGTYAEDATCAVSATGQGEFFIRHVVAHDIAAQMRYRNRSVGAAANDVVRRKLVAVQGEGAVIALDRRGNFSTPYNSEGLFRGWIGADGNPHTAIYER
jgi:isoaspartyl peptidase/L-asparaginase-like protein (Ntn-hydrolase superfamily)